MEKLNEHQEKAVTYNKGSLLVLAGPGSGKTKILTHRIAHILNDSLNERYKILALTFTNKASDEMKNRIKKLVYDTKSISRLSIGTFHGFAYKTLKSYGSYIGISSDFIIYDKKEDLYQILFDAIVKYIRNEQEDDTKRHILLRNEAFQNIALLENNIVNIFNIIEKIKHQIFKNEEFKKSYLYSEEIEIILEIYEKELKEYKILDYSDLLLKTIELFDKKDFLRKDYQKIYKHILVDEGQDTNKLQFELLKLLANNENNLFIVADEDQVIYEWNDAHFKYLLELRKRYKAEIIQLYETYRCPEQIIEIANKLIAHNKIRLTEKHKLKTLKRDQKENIIEVNKFRTSEEEVSDIKDKILKISKFNTCAIISRNRKILSEFKEIFRAKNIPYYIPSVQDKFVGQEINALLYLLKSIVNENDKIAIYRLCQFYNIDYNHVSYNDNLTLLQQFTKILKEENIVNLIKEIINDKVNFFKYIEKYMSEFDKKEDIDAFTEYYRNFNHTEEIKNLANFLNYIALYSNNKVIENAVALLTGHTAKGLEFDNVFLVSMNEGIFPDFRAKKGRKLEEERRNCYVAITRTKQKLFLSYTERKDTYYGDREHQPSRFLKEMELI